MFSRSPPQSVGNIRVYFRGAICLGPDYAWMLMTMTIIVVTSVLFLIYTNTVVVRVVCVCFGLPTLGLLFCCSTMDPGVCEKLLPPPTDAPPREPLEEVVAYVDGHGHQQHATVERRWCCACNIYKPLRASHCSFCDVCIARRDHHCQWVGTCIGERNYPFYWLFLWSFLGLTLTLGFGSVWSVIEKWLSLAKDPAFAEENTFFLALARSHFVEPVLVLFALILFCFLAPLTAYHTMLVAQNMTTIEEMRGSRGQAHYYSRGGCWENVKASLCSSFLPLTHPGVTGAYASPVDVAVMTEEV